MTALLKSVTRNSLWLGLFSLLTVGMITLTYMVTHKRIEEQVRLYERKALEEIVPSGTYDNDLLDNTAALMPSALLSTTKQRKVFIACRHGEPVTVIIPVIAPDGYNGAIELLVGIHKTGEISGVRAIVHRETPGLGDKISTAVSNWVLGFNGKSLEWPGQQGWHVRKDGGDFDQFTGATITPRAVVSAVYRALTYFKQNQTKLLQKQGCNNKNQLTSDSVLGSAVHD